MSEDVTSGEPAHWEGKNKSSYNQPSEEPEHWEGKNRSYYNKSSSYEAPEVSADTRADTKVVLIVMACLLLMAMHFVSGWTLDI